MSILLRILTLQVQRYQQIRVRRLKLSCLHKQRKTEPRPTDSDKYNAIDVQHVYTTQDNNIKLVVYFYCMELYTFIVWRLDV